MYVIYIGRMGQVGPGSRQKLLKKNVFRKHVKVGASCSKQKG
jgi:hypothetical protein